MGCHVENLIKERVGSKGPQIISHFNTLQTYYLLSFKHEIISTPTVTVQVLIFIFFSRQNCII